ncbi:MAG: endo alpha-1,4 polygalactosaminidase [Clostridia bacterium]|nr:endo alpha-1,4 polygalactosaminidase [Clostridia bacterium]
MKRIFLMAVLFTMITFIASANTYDSGKTAYGVFVGLDPSSKSKLYSYREVVIDASCFSASDINDIKNKGIKVFSYLNIGSIEDFRECFLKFEHIALGNYENWPGEKWIDVSDLSWQDYIVNTAAKNLIDKGVDGFFIDNVDVYSFCKKDNIFYSIVSILEKLNSTYKKPVIVNGGYDFFTKAMAEKINLCGLAYGVNTESVITTIDFKSNSFLKNSVENRNNAIEYLKILQKNGLSIYVIEYSKNKKLNLEIAKRYNELGFKYYISSSINLD